MKKTIALLALCLTFSGCGTASEASSTLGAFRSVRQLLCGGLEAGERELEAFIEAAAAKERAAEEEAPATAGGED